MTLLYFHFAFFFVSFLSKFHVNPSGGFGFVSSCVITKLATKTLKKNNLVRGYNYYQSVFAKSQKKKKKKIKNVTIMVFELLKKAIKGELFQSNFFFFSLPKLRRIFSL